MIHRRGFMGGLIAALGAPAIVRTPGLLMPVKRLPSTAFDPEFRVIDHMADTQRFYIAAGWDAHGNWVEERIPAPSLGTLYGGKSFRSVDAITRQDALPRSEYTPPRDFVQTWTDANRMWSYPGAITSA